jgi:putative membrane protein
MRLLLSILINGLAVYLSARLLSGVTVDGYGSALLAGVVLGIINWTVRPILTILTLPLTVITFGLFYLLINGLMVLLADSLVGGFEVASIWWAFLFLLILSILNSILQGLVGREEPPQQ